MHRGVADAVDLGWYRWVIGFSAERQSSLLEQLGLGDTLVAVERNREIIPRAQHVSATLNDGDALEVVHFVGGG